MTTASQKAYIEQIQSGKAKGNAQQIYNLLSHSDKGLSIRYICTALELSHQTATARLSELCDLGVVFIDHTKDDLSIFKIETIPFLIKNNRFNRKKEKVDKWMKKGVSLGINFKILN